MINKHQMADYSVKHDFADGGLITDALSAPLPAIAYRTAEELARRYPDHAILESSDTDFDVERFAQAGHCELLAHEDYHAEQIAFWDVDARAIMRSSEQGWYRITWNGISYQVLRLTIHDGCGGKVIRWLIADKASDAEALFSAVAIWSNTLDQSILVFQDGYWQKNEALYHSIQGATLANLILAGSLKEDLYRDLSAFFAARDVYKRAGIPWKRGIVLIGPPGNGKTHTIKALINALDKPCLYVKSFSSQHVDDHHNIQQVFVKARESAPCILVLEDLDSLITEHNRSFFLNELDGFAANEGIVTIASTNHPKRLDPAIMARPSRFDRKYHFELPGSAECHAYLDLWRVQLDDAMRPSAATIAALAEDTDGFSFAYLKELLIASTVRWAEHQQADTMDAILPAELVALRTQMRSMVAEGESQ